MAEVGVPDQFPAGLRVLVVDDDFTCLKILEQMLRRCMYQATTVSQAAVALNLLRERKGCFDVVLSDVHMPDMDGFKLLELVGLEMDLPVIMMSADGSTSAVMKGIKHGACDYLIKPIREEELKNLWQHVVRKKWNGNKEPEQSGSLDDNERNRVGSDEPEIDGGGEGSSKPPKKRKDAKEDDDGEVENDDSGTAKKPRVVWSVELHQQFVSAVNHLGIDKAVPKRILELMNVPGLTRENVASHLQKFRLYLKRLSGVGHQGGLSSQYCGSVEQNAQLGSFGRFDMQALAASGQIPPQTLAALQAELLGRPILPVMDQSLLQASPHGSKAAQVDHGVAYGQPLLGCPSNISKQFPQTIISADSVHSAHGAWPSSDLGAVGPKSRNDLGTVGPTRSINVQPSCLVVPSQSSSSFQAVRSPASVNQNNSFSRSSSIDYSLLSPQGQLLDEDPKTSLRNVYPVTASPSASQSSLNADKRQLHVSTLASNAGRQLLPGAPNFCDIQSSSHYTEPRQVLDQSPLRNLGFVGKGTSIPSRFAVNELDPPINSLNYGKIYGETNGNKVKQEPGVNFIENGKVGMQALQNFTSNDLMGVFSD